MKAHTKYLTLNIPSKMAFRNITPEVDEAVRKSGVQEGLVLVNTMHITASVFINDNEPGLHHDFGKWLEELAPFNPDPNHYHHNRTGEDNADAHLKRQIMGREVVVAITKGQTGFRTMGADFLWRVRRESEQACPHKSDWGVTRDWGLGLGTRPELANTRDTRACTNPQSLVPIPSPHPYNSKEASAFRSSPALFPA